MRRSCAPSIRKNLQKSTGIKPLQQPNEESAKAEVNTGVPKNYIQFNVCYGKITNKKHKTWEGDGILIITENRLTLKDINGRVLESTPNTKNNDLGEGSRVCVGSKEIEIIDRRVVEQDDRNISNIKRMSETIPKSGFSFKKIKKFQTPQIMLADNDSEIKFEPLKLPNPSFIHEQKYNKTNQSLTDVYVPSSLSKVLRPHQRTGVIFLYECLMGYRFNEKGEYFGAILADEMGLGKTLQCITVCYTLLKFGPYGNLSIARKVLIVTPSSLVENWDREIMKWLKNEKIFTYIVDSKHKPEKCPHHIPFMLISYEMLVNNFDSVRNQKFDIIICDEGHRLKNSNIKVSTMLSEMRCLRRIILTGTPIQNDLHEFYSLINFVNPGILGDYNEYKKYYEIPIVQSQQSNVLPQFREIGEERAMELNKIIQAFVLRRTSDVINKYLPRKEEVVIFCLPTELQKFMLRSTVEHYTEYDSNISPLEVITMLKKICNHPSLIQTTSKGTSSSLTTFLKSILPPWDEMGPYDSSKLSVVMELLKNLINRHEKIVLISYYTKTLDMLMNLCEHMNYRYSRLDGTTPTGDRQKLVEQFNSTTSDTFVFLLSAKAGGVGLNLIGASRLVLFDNDWNPASDLQAMSRIWRDGQAKDVYIYRLITAGAIEEKIYQRQISKTALSGCVVETQFSGAVKLSDDELKDLFTIDSDNIQNATDVVDCLTHKIMQCECLGTGDKVKLCSQNPKKNALKMNELMQWEHHRTPINPKIITDLCVSGAEDEILFIFRNQTDVQYLKASNK